MKTKRIPWLLLCLFGLSVHLNAQNNHNDRSGRKALEIGQFVTLTPLQQDMITTAYGDYLLSVDSSLYVVTSASVSAQMRYDAGKRFHNILVSILSDRQIYEYAVGNFAPEVRAKADYRVALLAGHGNYSQSALLEMRDRIFDYLMQEKIVYFREKYDYPTQKENIRRLKKTQPACLVESNLIEKRLGQTSMITPTD